MPRRSPAVVALLVAAACGPPRGAVCVGDACGCDDTPTTPHETGAPPVVAPVDSGGVVAATLVRIDQRAGYVHVTHDLSVPGVLHVGAWSGPVVGYGVTVAPVQYDDLCILDQDIWIRLVVDGVEAAAVLYDTHAQVRRPGDWRWHTDGDGATIVECGIPVGVVRAYHSIHVDVVWHADAAPAWHRVEWTDREGSWSMSPDRIRGYHPPGLDVGGTLEAEPAAPLAVAVVRWSE